MGIKYCFITLVITMAVLTAACVEKEKPVGEEERPVTGREMVEGIPIAAILVDRESYRDKEVAVSGKAKPGLAFEFVDEQPYILDDGSGEIWVITRDVMPAEGAWVTVRGVVRMPYQIRGRSYEIAVIETEREE